MGLNLGKIFKAVTDIVPLGGIAKTIIKGAGSLLIKKAAKAVGIPEEKTEAMIAEAARLAEYDHEIRKLLIDEEKQKRAHELALFGRFADLDTGSKKLRARIRPLLSLGLVGTYLAYCWVHLISQMFPHVVGFEFLPEFPPALIKVTIWVCGFWFVGRTVEKVTDIVKNGKDKDPLFDISTITNWK
jgi:hypothetical protein